MKSPTLSVAAVAALICAAVTGLTAQRDQLATKIKSELDAAAFTGKSLDEGQAKHQIRQAWSLIGQARALAS